MRIVNMGIAFLLCIWNTPTYAQEIIDAVYTYTIPREGSGTQSGFLVQDNGQTITFKTTVGRMVSVSTAKLSKQDKARLEFLRLPKDQRDAITRKEQEARHPIDAPVDAKIVRYDKPTQPDPPKKLPSDLLSNAETELRQDHGGAVMDIFNSLLLESPDSHEAKTVIGLIELARQQGATQYKESVSTCKLTDIQSLKKSFDSMELIARSYQTAELDKRQAIDTIFGPATFSNPNLSLDGLLNAMRQMDAAKQKAIRGE